MIYLAAIIVVTIGFVSVLQREHGYTRATVRKQRAMRLDLRAALRRGRS